MAKNTVSFINDNLKNFIGKNTLNIILIVLIVIVMLYISSFEHKTARQHELYSQSLVLNKNLKAEVKALNIKVSQYASKSALNNYVATHTLSKITQSNEVILN
ncbi:MAG: hypothetical protein R3Y52_01780 [Psittacicella sp.]